MKKVFWITSGEFSKLAYSQYIDRSYFEKILIEIIKRELNKNFKDKFLFVSPYPNTKESAEQLRNIAKNILGYKKGFRPKTFIIAQGTKTGKPKLDYVRLCEQHFLVLKSEEDYNLLSLCI